MIIMYRTLVKVKEKAMTLDEKLAAAIMGAINAWIQMEPANLPQDSCAQTTPDKSSDTKK
jgi:hypothetical protein